MQRTAGTHAQLGEGGRSGLDGRKQQLAADRALVQRLGAAERRRRLIWQARDSPRNGHAQAVQGKPPDGSLLRAQKAGVADNDADSSTPDVGVLGSTVAVPQRAAAGFLTASSARVLKIAGRSSLSSTLMSSSASSSPAHQSRCVTFIGRCSPALLSLCQKVASCLMRDL